MRRSLRELLLRMRGRGIDETRRKVGGVNKSVSKLDRLWGKLGKSSTRALQATGAAATAAAAAAGFAAVKVGRSIIDTGSQMEKFRIQLRVVLKDEQAALDLLKDISAFAASTPFELPELVQSSIRLEQFGLDSKNVLETIGDTAAALDVKILQVADAVARATAGEFESLRLFGINISKINAELGHKIGRETQAQLQENTRAVLSIMDREFGGGMRELSKAWSGILSNFSDFFFRFRDNIAEGGVFETVKKDAAELLELLNRFSAEGGVDAFSGGFNRAFEEIHKSFFSPFFDSLDTMELDVVRIGAVTELTVLRIADTTVAAADAIGSTSARAGVIIKLLAKSTNFLDQNFDAIGLAKDTFSAFKNINEQSDKTTEQLTSMRDRIKEITQALIDLGKNPSIDEIFSPTDLTPLEVLGIESPLQPTKKTPTKGGTGSAFKDAGGGADVSGDAAKRAEVAFRGLRDTSRFTLDDLSTGTSEFGDNLRLFGEEHTDISTRIIEDLDNRMQAEAALAEATLNANQIVLDDEQLTAEERAQTAADLADELEAIESQIEAMRIARGKAAFQTILGMTADFAKKNISIRKQLGKFLIASSGEVAKAVIDNLTAESRVKGAKELAESIASLAIGDFRGAVLHGGAAAQFLAVAGAGKIGKALIDRSVESRTAGVDDSQLDTGTRFKSRGTTRNTAGVARTALAPQTFNITINNNIGGDYNINEGSLTDAEQIQDLFDSGLVTVN